MSRRLLAAAVIASAVLVVAMRETSSAQSGSAWVTPRTPWGDPDLQGVWPGTAMMGVPIERPRQPGASGQAAPPAAAGRGAGAGTGPPGHWGERGQPQQQASLIVDPADGRIPPMTPEGQRRTAEVPKTWYYDNDGGGPFSTRSQSTTR